jgi:hypothetical protein
MKNLEQLNAIGKDLSKSLKQLEQFQRRFLADLPNDLKEKVQPIQKDIESTLKAMRKGDTNKINELTKRYANSDSK